MVWIDPLDATGAFVRGDIDHVTVMIGLSVDSVSRIGVLHKPFKKKSDWMSDWDKGATIFGSPEHGLLEVKYHPNMQTPELLARSIKYFPPFDDAEMKPPSDLKIQLGTSG